MNSQKFAADNSIPDEVKKFVKKSISRRSVLAGVGGIGAAAALSACSSGGSDKAAADALRWANWTLYLDYDSDTKKFPTLEDFQSQSGIKVNYKEDVNDNAEFFGKVKDQLALDRKSTRLNSSHT